MVKNQKPSWIDGLKSLPTILASTGIIVIVLLETIQSLCRYCFRFTFQFVDDVVVISFAWVVFAGAAAAYRAGMHYGIDVAEKLVPKKALPAFKLFVLGISICLFAFLLYHSVILFITSGTRTFPTTHLSYKFVYAAVIYGLAMILIYGVKNFVRDAKALKVKGGGEEK